MVRITAKQARDRMSSLLDRVELGEEVVILRRGKEVARLVPQPKIPRTLPPLDDFRGKIRIKGSLTKSLLEERAASRY
ncbi:MAG: type II toxin-antitoxin system prevent-host-death family antitoxin [Nitrospirae bacterium]|nr:type II toxin-antitoxin system prevent-host-death family antitoxin [Nitrospirota bacterium]MBI3393719.1 type II toxin-antitoxin system prevent-host-death family antitoxin [Nitrospirota bacterium]